MSGQELTDEERAALIEEMVRLEGCDDDDAYIAVLEKIDEAGLKEVYRRLGLDWEGAEAHCQWLDAVVKAHHDRPVSELVAALKTQKPDRLN